MDELSLTPVTRSNWPGEREERLDHFYFNLAMNAWVEGRPNVLIDPIEAISGFELLLGLMMALTHYCWRTIADCFSYKIRRG